jgi:hypothetical protein
MQQKDTYKISKFDIFSNQELAELPKLLLPGEKVLSVISGFYAAGMAILCVTSKRLLLIDKKLIRLNFEDIRFESISEVNYSHQLILASLNLYYAGRSLQFRTWYKDALRTQAQFIQGKIFDSRQTGDRQVSTFNSPEIEYAGELKELEPDSPGFKPNIGPESVVQTPEKQNGNTLEQFVNQRNTKWVRAKRLTGGVNIARIGRQVIGASRGE